MNKMDLRRHWATSDSVLLMCKPEFYGIPKPDQEMGHANAMAAAHYEEYIKDPSTYRKIANAQWTALKAAFDTLGVKVVEVDPVTGQLDQVFTADPTLSLVMISESEAAAADPREITIISNFSNIQRQPEVDAAIAFIEENLPRRPLVRSHFKMEGTGDNVYDPFRDVFWSGFLPQISDASGLPSEGRSDVRAHATLSSVTGVDVISMNVLGRDKGFFHIDTSMAPLSKGHIMCYKNGMSTEAYNRILMQGLASYGLPHDQYLIEVGEEDAHRFACNVRSIGDTIVMPMCSDDLKGRLEYAGYNVVRTDMSHFIGNGGAVHCVTNNLNEQRVKGGTCEQYSFGRTAPVATPV